MKHPSMCTLHDYVEDQLPALQSKIVKEHLMDCKECSQQVEDLMAVDQKFLTAAVVPSDDLRQKIFAQCAPMLEQKRIEHQKKENSLSLAEQFALWMSELRGGMQLQAASLAMAFVLGGVAYKTFLEEGTQGGQLAQQSQKSKKRNIRFKSPSEAYRSGDILGDSLNGEPIPVKAQYRQDYQQYYTPANYRPVRRR